MKKSVRWNKRLEPFGNLICGMYVLVGKASNRDLVQLANACKKASTTNIWWASYEAAQLLPKMIEDEQYGRKQRAEMGKRADEVKP